MAILVMCSIAHYYTVPHLTAQRIAGRPKVVLGQACAAITE